MMRYILYLCLLFLASVLAINKVSFDGYDTQARTLTLGIQTATLGTTLSSSAYIRFRCPDVLYLTDASVCVAASGSVPLMESMPGFRVINDIEYFTLKIDTSMSIPSATPISITCTNMLVNLVDYRDNTDLRELDRVTIHSAADDSTLVTHTFASSNFVIDSSLNSVALGTLSATHTSLSTTNEYPQRTKGSMTLEYSSFPHALLPNSTLTLSLSLPSGGAVTWSPDELNAHIFCSLSTKYPTTRAINTTQSTVAVLTSSTSMLVTLNTTIPHSTPISLTCMDITPPNARLALTATLVNPAIRYAAPTDFSAQTAAVPVTARVPAASALDVVLDLDDRGWSIDFPALSYSLLESAHKFEVVLPAPYHSSKQAASCVIYTEKTSIGTDGQEKRETFEGVLSFVLPTSDPLTIILKPDSTFSYVDGAETYSIRCSNMYASADLRPDTSIYDVPSVAPQFSLSDTTELKFRHLLHLQTLTDDVAVIPSPPSFIVHNLEGAARLFAVNLTLFGVPSNTYNLPASASAAAKDSSIVIGVGDHILVQLPWFVFVTTQSRCVLHYSVQLGEKPNEVVRNEVIGVDSLKVDFDMLDVTVPSYIMYEHRELSAWKPTYLQCQLTYTDSSIGSLEEEDLAVRVTHTNANYKMLETMTAQFPTINKRVQNRAVSLSLAYASPIVREWNYGGGSGSSGGSVSQLLRKNAFNAGVVGSDLTSVDVTLRFEPTGSTIIYDGSLITVSLPPNMLVYNSQRDCRVSSFIYITFSNSQSSVNPFSLVATPVNVASSVNSGNFTFANTLTVMFTSPDATFLGTGSQVVVTCASRLNTPAPANMFPSVATIASATTVFESESAATPETYRHQAATLSGGYWPPADAPVAADGSYGSHYGAAGSMEAAFSWRDYVRTGARSSVQDMMDYFSATNPDTHAVLALTNVVASLRTASAFVIDFGYLNAYTEGESQAWVVVQGNRYPLTITAAASKTSALMSQYLNWNSRAASSGVTENVLVATVGDSSWTGINAYAQTVELHITNLQVANANKDLVLPRVRVLDTQKRVLFDRHILAERLYPAAPYPDNGNLVDRGSIAGAGGGGVGGDKLDVETAIPNTYSKMSYHILGSGVQIGYLPRAVVDVTATHSTSTSTTTANGNTMNLSYSISNDKVQYTNVTFSQLGDADPLTNTTLTTVGTLISTHTLTCSAIMGTAWDSDSVYKLNGQLLDASKIQATANSIRFTLPSTFRSFINDTLTLEASSLRINDYASQLMSCAVARQDTHTWTMRNVTYVRANPDAETSETSTYTTITTTTDSSANPTRRLLTSRLTVGTPQTTPTATNALTPSATRLTASTRLVTRTITLAFSFPAPVQLVAGDILMARLPAAWTIAAHAQCSITTGAMKQVLLPVTPTNYYNASASLDSGPAAGAAVPYLDLKYRVSADTLSEASITLTCDNVDITQFAGSLNHQWYHVRGSRVLVYTQTVAIDPIFLPSGLTTRYFTPDNLIRTQPYSYLYGLIDKTSATIYANDYVVITFPSTAVGAANKHSGLQWTVVYDQYNEMTTNCGIFLSSAYSDIVSVTDREDPAFYLDAHRIKLRFEREIAANTVLYLRCTGLQLDKTIPITLTPSTPTTAISTLSSSAIGAVYFDVFRPTLTPPLFLATELSIPAFLSSSGSDRHILALGSPAGNTTTSIDVVISPFVTPRVSDVLTIQIPNTWSVNSNTFKCGSSVTSTDQLGSLTLQTVRDPATNAITQQLIRGVYTVSSLKPTSALYMRCFGIQLPETDVVYQGLSVQLTRAGVVVMGAYNINTNSAISSVRDIVTFTVDLQQAVRITSTQQYRLEKAINGAFVNTVLSGRVFLLHQQIAYDDIGYLAVNTSSPVVQTSTAPAAYLDTYDVNTATLTTTPVSPLAARLRLTFAFKRVDTTTIESQVALVTVQAATIAAQLQKERVQFFGIAPPSVTYYSSACFAGPGSDVVKCTDAYIQGTSDNAGVDRFDAEFPVTVDCAIGPVTVLSAHVDELGNYVTDSRAVCAQTALQTHMWRMDRHRDAFSAATALVNTVPAATHPAALLSRAVAPVWDGTTVAGCPLCSVGQKCTSSSQCLSGSCNPLYDYICVASTNVSAVAGAGVWVFLALLVTMWMVV